MFPTFGRATSDLVAAVDADDLARDAPAVLRGEQRRHARELVGLEHPVLQVLAGGPRLLRFRRGPAVAGDPFEVEQRRARPARAEAVDVDAVAGDGRGELAGEADEAVLGRRVP